MSHLALLSSGESSPPSPGILPFAVPPVVDSPTAMPTDPHKTRYYRKQTPLFRLVEKMKLWPSRRGILHGVREFQPRGQYAVIITHCNKHMVVHDSKTSRAARWLRNKWYAEACPECRIPEWKLQKYTATHFRRGYGSHLRGDGESG